MEVLNLVLVYLQNLMHADVTIHKEETDQVWFNEARSISVSIRRNAPFTL